MEMMQSRVLSKAKRQYEWKNEAIDKAITVLTESTYKTRDEACKVLLKHLQNMPQIYLDIDLEPDGLPF
jgi:hypothetical protein